MLRTFGKTTLLAAALRRRHFGLLQPLGTRHQLPSKVSRNMPDRLPDGPLLDQPLRCRCVRTTAARQRPTVNCRAQYYGQPELFYNYYVPGTCGGVPANMYVAPQPVPAWVGHTYYTYQPFMPHELLYQHHRTYYRYYDGGRGMTRTTCLVVPARRLPVGTSILRIAR